MVGVQGWSAVGEIQEGSAGERALLQAARSGDPHALDQLIALHYDPLFVLCWSILGHADDAQDAVQESFLRALRALPQFRGDAAFRTWLFRIAIHLCGNWKRHRRPTEPWDESRPGNLPGAPSPETLALRHLQMREALSTLRPHHRAVFLLKEQEGWSMAEIAAALGWTERRVQNELYRARRALLQWRQRIAGDGEEP
jgi:RNA polymerase sigma-70 factor (ECF subfamily)